MVAENRERLLSTSTKLLSDLPSYINHYLPRRLDALVKKASNINTSVPEEMTKDLAGVIERAVLKTLERLSDLIVDLRMVQEYIDHNLAAGQQDFDDAIRRQQVVAGVVPLHQQLLAIKTALETKVTQGGNQRPDLSQGTSPLDSTILADILLRIPNFFTVISQDGNPVQAATDLVLGSFFTP